MWSYYGSKYKLARLYPYPKYDIIIEPFAGAAWYSVLHRNKNIILNENYSIIYDIWDWLIHEATSEIILNNINFYAGQDIRFLDLAEPHRNLIGFCINRGSVSPKNIVQKWSCQSKIDFNWASTTSYQLSRIAKLLPEIKHWKVKFGDYKDIPNIDATWFIDSPYKNGGEHYIINNIDYSELADWCKTRKGQVIVCENEEANWLDFKPLAKITGQSKKTTEVVWLNENYT
jgi:hypothetical protein